MADVDLPEVKNYHHRRYIIRSSITSQSGGGGGIYSLSLKVPYSQAEDAETVFAGGA